MAVDADTLATSLQRLRARGEGEDDLVAALQQVIEACVDLFGVTGSGMMIADQQSIARYVAASDGPSRIMEMAESETGQGPCITAFVTNTAVGVRDVTAEEQWPDLAAALAPHQVRAVLGVPVRLAGTPVGTLDVYRDTPHDWDETERSALMRYGEVVEATLAAALAAHRAEQLADQLQYALDYRVVIERGVGYLMARDGVDALVAFNRLRRAARSNQAKIGEVAEQLLATGRLPSEQRRPRG